MADLIKIALQGVESTRSIIREMIARGRNLRPLQWEIAGIIRDEVEQNFQAGGRDPQWPASKRVQEKGGQTLIDKGNLEKSIRTFVERNAAGVGTNLAYAAIHNFGGVIQRYPFSMPVRLRTDAKGNLLRQSQYNSLAVFARSSHKRAATRWYTSNGYKISMPQREFMKVSPAGIGEIEAAAAAFILP